MRSELPKVPGPAGMSRRGLLAAGLASTLPWADLARAQGSGAIRLGQSADLSGPLGELGQALRAGAKLHFDAVNARGGVHGLPIELETRDDGYDGERAKANVSDFLADPRTFALFNCLGTPVMEAVLPQVIESGVPFFAPFSGAVLPPMKTARNVFVVRANYADETEKLVRHLGTVGIKRLGIAHQNNAFGQDVLEGAREAIKRHRLAPPAFASVESDGSDAGKAASALAAAAPEAVLIGLSGKAALEFVRAIRAQRRGVPLYALSVIGTASMIKQLGEDAKGISLSQVVPPLSNPSVPVVRDFLRAWKDSGNTQTPSHLSLEGYINAKVFTEALGSAGRNPTRAAFIDAARKMRRYDLGGFEVGFPEVGRSGSRFVELTMVRWDGQLMR